MTINNTNTGATAFKAPTNNDPKIETHPVISGIVRAKITPIINPTSIRFTKLI